MESSVIKVGGMSCQGCVRNITGVLTGIAGVTAAEVSLEAGEARVTFDPQQVARPCCKRGRSTKWSRRKPTRCAWPASRASW